MGGLAPLGSSLHTHDRGFGLIDSDVASDNDAARVFRGLAQAIGSYQSSPGGVRIYEAQVGPVSATCGEIEARERWRQVKDGGK